MRTAYFDCTSGISGNMVIGAMIDAGMPLDDLRTEIDKVLPRGSYGLALARLGTPEAPFTYFNTVLPDGREQGRGIGDLDTAGVAALIRGSALDEDMKREVERIFSILVAAKAEAHGSPEGSVRFREEGLSDTLIDILGAVVSLRHFGIDRVVATPLNVGSGKLLIAAKEVSIPAPMTRILLRGVPHYSDGRLGELVTPTGAAILTGIANQYLEEIPEGLIHMGMGAPVGDAGPDAALRVYLHPDDAGRKRR